MQWLNGNVFDQESMGSKGGIHKTTVKCACITHFY